MAADHQSIVDVTIAYCWALDERAWPRLAEVFTPDATAHLAGLDVSGLDAIIERVASILTPLDRSQHYVTNHQTHDDGDRASCRCYLQAQHVRRAASAGPNFLVAGRYHDDLVRTKAGWRISHRDLVMTWTEGNPAVIQLP